MLISPHPKSLSVVTVVKPYYVQVTATAKLSYIFLFFFIIIPIGVTDLQYKSNAISFFMFSTSAGEDATWLVTCRWHAALALAFSMLPSSTYLKTLMQDSHFKMSQLETLS